MTRGRGQDESEAEELDFVREDTRLPWLEADDDYEEPGVPAGRIAGFIIAALLVIGAIVGGAYWLLGRQDDPAIVADGSTIKAPAGPYKTKPDNPGGATALGTGDTSFAVAEGRSPVARVAPAKPVPAPSIDTEKAQPGGPTGVGVQVGAYTSRERAEQGWQVLVARHEILGGFNHRVVEGVVDGSTVYRLQAVTGSSAAARELCNALKANGADCQVKG